MATEEGQDDVLAVVEGSVFHVDERDGPADLRQRQNAGRDLAGIAAETPALDDADGCFDGIGHGYFELAAINSRISFLAAFQRGTSILVPITSTTLAAMTEPISPQTFSGMPREWA